MFYIDNSDSESEASDATPRQHPKASRAASVKSHKSRHSRTSTNFSMTSSSMFRNEKLTLLDDQFDKIMAEYEDEDLGELDPEDDDVQGLFDPLTNESIDSEEMQRLDDLFNEFLGSTQLNASESRLVDRHDPAESLTDVRNELKHDVKGLTERYGMETDFNEGPIRMPVPKKEKWDVETVLSGATNIYNRPSLIRELSGPRISFKRGMPQTEPITPEKSESEEEEEEEIKENKGAKRNGNETSEEKKARKSQIKDERRAAREMKKKVKDAFKVEFKSQGKMEGNHKMMEKVQHIQ